MLSEDVATTSSSAEAVAEVQETENAQSGKATVVTNPDMLQQLVEEAVKNVLANQEVGDKDKVSQTIVSQVVQGLKPTLELKPAVQQPEVPVMARHMNIPQQIMKPVVYNPTPIAELKKRHIPVYMPTRDTKIAIKRKASPDNKPWSSTVFTTEVTYKPTAISTSNSDEIVKSYVPTVKASIPENNPYDDGISSKKEIYYPKTKKKREEYIPKMVKTPLKVEEEVSYIPSVSRANHSDDPPMEVEPKFSDDECETLVEEKIDRCGGETSTYSRY